MIQTASIKKALRALRTQESVLQAQLAKVRETTSHLIRMTEGKVNSSAFSRSSTGRATSGPERLSAKGRAAISRAAKRRWAEYRRQQAQQGKLNQTG